MCKGVPYLDFCGNQDAFVIIQTVREKFVMFTEKQAEKAIESRDMQARMAHPNNEKLKLLVSSKVLITALLLPVRSLTPVPCLVQTVQV